MGKVYLETWIPLKPLSANRMHYAKYKKDTKEYKQYKEAVARELEGDYGIKPSDLLKLTLIAGFTNKASDLDNAFKPLIDSMQLCMDFDDKQIYEIIAYKDVGPKDSGYLYIKLEQVKLPRITRLIKKLKEILK